MFKCEYYKTCTYYAKDSYTCNKGKKNKNYCGSYKQKKINEKLIKKKK